MQIKTPNAEDFVMAVVGLTGELPVKAFADINTRYSEDYLQNTISKLCRGKKLRKIKAESGDVFLRLSFPEGDWHLKNISEELYRNFLLLSEGLPEDPARRYKGVSSRKWRRQCMGMIIGDLMRCGIEINCFDISFTPKEPLAGMPDIKPVSSGIFKTKTVFDRNLKALPFEEINSRRESKDRLFVTTHFLRPNYSGGSFHSKEEASRRFGMLLLGWRNFIIYCPNEKPYRWTRDLERDCRFRLEAVTENKIFGLFYVTNPDIYIDLVKPERICKSACMPLSVFEDAYLVPLFNSGKLIAGILSQPSGEEKLLEAVLRGGVSKGGTYDGMFGETAVFSFLTGNMRKLQEAKKYISEKGSGAVILCDYQEEAVRRFLGMKKETAAEHMIIISLKAFEVIAGKIQKGGDV